MSTAPTAFAGLRVAAFESRMAGPMAELIRKHGGDPLVAPSLREVPLSENPDALAFADRLMAGGLDMVIFLTGVGTRYLAGAIETRYDRAEWVEALKRTMIVARGPKPMAALRELGARVDVQVPEPNTWNEILATLDDRLDLAKFRIAVQEYGKPNPELEEGLRDRARRSIGCRSIAGRCPKTSAPCGARSPRSPTAGSARRCSPRRSRSSTCCESPRTRPWKWTCGTP